jgi:hypothetical protein
MEMTGSERQIIEALRGKVFEAVERTAHLVCLVPPNRLEWRPELPNCDLPASDLGHLLGHLLDCLAGFCAAFYATFPDELADFGELRSIPVSQFCRPDDAARNIELYTKHIDRGFQLCTDEDLRRKIRTVFVPGAERLLTVLLGNLEHLINHKYQLFFYLKLMGVPLTTTDLYVFRGAQETRA